MHDPDDEHTELLLELALHFRLCRLAREATCDVTSAAHLRGTREAGFREEHRAVGLE